MADIKQIDREAVLKAIEIIRNNPELRNGRESTTYDLIYDENAYPPILVLSEANKLLDGNELTLSNFNNNTDRAFKILRELGFEVKNKSDVESIQYELINQYKNLVSKDQNEPELYKWQLIKEFQQKWNIEADDFAAMLQSINFENLLDFRSKTLIIFSNEYSEEARSLFKMLFDEEIPLEKRIKDFGDSAEKIVRKRHPDKGSFQDERSIATYLTFRYPNKYTFYKYTLYSDYADILNIDKVKVGERYIHYLQLIDEFVEEYISKDEELISLSRATLTEDCFTDTNYNILAQDILYRVIQQDNNGQDFELSLRSTLKNIGSEKSVGFFDTLTNLVLKLNLKEGDNRVVYSVREDINRLVFIVGQRYCLIIQNKGNRPWGYITLNEDQEAVSTEFEGSTKAYWNETDSNNIVNNALTEIKQACLSELARTKRSSFLKYNNSSFEKAVFDEEYRYELFNDLNEQKMTPEPFLETLKKFLEQSKTDDLSYAHYQNEYNGLNVRASFGKGNIARIPWISFLDDTQSTNDGIYPVYLLYKERNLLILAYGVSEENEPRLKWDIDNPVTIKDYFEENNLGRPERYGSSFLFKVYDLNNSINDYRIDDDLFQLTNFYKKIISIQEPETVKTPFNLGPLLTSLNGSGLIYDENLITRFTSAIITKPFLILTGLSGSGKTKLAQAFVEWICEEKRQFNIVPVGADWTNREPLFGYPNALKPDDYVLPETGILQLILQANNDPSHPYFIILDEMNLSHVERYFADFLSAIESNEEIKLHSGNESWENGEYVIPPAIKIPKNLFIIGTVNIDETTYMFSPKVLDRANVIEFRVSQKELAEFLKNPADVDLDFLSNQGAFMAEDFVQIATNSANNYSQKENLSEELLKFFSELNKVGAEFGYRSAFEIQRFAALTEKLAEDWKFEQIMDAAIAQKLLPKLHGSRRKLEKVLFKLGQLCLTEGDAEEFLKKPESIIWEHVKYPISFEKIIRMHKGLVENGFTSFAEA